MTKQKRMDLSGHSFSDTQFMAADERVRVLRDWERFLRLGMEFKNFSKVLYHHLTLHCSFIALYDRQRFYNYYFNQPEPTVRFLSHFDRNHASGLARWWLSGDYADVNEAMCDVVTAYAPGYYGLLEQAAKKRDLAEAERLLHKWGQ